MYDTKNKSNLLMNMFKNHTGMQLLQINVQLLIDNFQFILVQATTFLALKVYLCRV